MQGQKALRFHQNILIRVPTMNEGLAGLERHEDEQVMKKNVCFWVNYPFNDLLIKTFTMSFSFFI